MILNPYKEAHLRPQHLDSRLLPLKPATSSTSWTLFLQTLRSFRNCLDFSQTFPTPTTSRGAKMFHGEYMIVYGKSSQSASKASPKFPDSLWNSHITLSTNFQNRSGFSIFPWNLRPTFAWTLYRLYLLGTLWQLTSCVYARLKCHLSCAVKA